MSATAFLITRYIAVLGRSRKHWHRGWGGNILYRNKVRFPGTGKRTVSRDWETYRRNKASSLEFPVCSLQCVIITCDLVLWAAPGGPTVLVVSPGREAHLSLIIEGRTMGRAYYLKAGYSDPPLPASKQNLTCEWPWPIEDGVSPSTPLTKVLRHLCVRATYQIKYNQQNCQRTVLLLCVYVGSV